MITDKQFEEYIKFIRKLLFDGNDVYIHGKKVVRTQLRTDDQFEYRSEKEAKIWTKSTGENTYVTYSKQSFNNDTKLQRLYDVTQTMRNDYTYMQAKLALKKYEERYGSQGGSDRNTIRNDGSSEE